MKKAHAAGIIGLAAILSACASHHEPPVPQTVTNQGLGIELASLPPGFSVVTNDGTSMVLQHGDTRVVITSSAPQDEVNLVAAVQDRQRDVEAKGGTFKGSRELRTDIGPAFTARSVLPAPGGSTEQLDIFSLNPSNRSRMLSLAATYPAGTAESTTAHVKSLLDLFAQIDPVASSPPTP